MATSDHTDGVTEPTLDIDACSFDPDVGDYSPTSKFTTQTKNKLKGIIDGDVIGACFAGDVEPAYGEDNVMMVGRLHDCVFGLVLDTEQKNVVVAHVLQCNPVQARISGKWDEKTIERMQELSKNHQGKVWQGYDDPKIGNKSYWAPDREYY